MERQNMPLNLHCTETDFPPSVDSGLVAEDGAAVQKTDPNPCPRGDCSLVRVKQK